MNRSAELQPRSVSAPACASAHPTALWLAAPLRLETSRAPLAGSAASDPARAIGVELRLRRAGGRLSNSVVHRPNAWAKAKGGCP